MTKEEFIKRHCHYLNTDDKYVIGTLPYRFMMLESYYTTEVGEDERAKWEDEHLPKCIKMLPNLAPILKGNRFSKETKGMIAYMIIMQDYNAPGTNMDFFLEYGKPVDKKDIIPPVQPEPLAEFTKEVQDAMAEQNEKGNPHLYKYCRFFKGEKECPFKPGTPQNEYWWAENVWVLHVHNDAILRDQVTFQFDITWRDKLDYIEMNDELKATLFDQYYNNVQNADGFEDWLVAYYTFND